MARARIVRPAPAFPLLIVFLLPLVAAAAAVGQETETATATAPAAVPNPTPNTRALQPGAERPQAKVEALAWIAGHWRGPGLGGTSEEVWTEPSGGAMLGMFRSLGPDGEVRFYELFTLGPDDEGSLTIRLKHFNPDMTGWEEKDEMVTFPLVALSEDAAWFDRLTFHRAGPDELHVHLAIGQPDGTAREETFRYHRIGIARATSGAASTGLVSSSVATRNASVP